MKAYDVWTPERLAQEPEGYKVMRNCCTSGNCVNCLDLPVGSKHRVSQMGEARLSKEYAEQIALNWKAYSPTVEKW